MLSDLCPFIDEWIIRIYKPDGTDSFMRFLINMNKVM